MRYFLIAGEASGDLHASHLIASLKEADPKAEFCFLGGDLMAEASGQSPIVHYREMAYMGFLDIVKNLGSIMRNFKAARQAIDEFKPDRVILIDYPSFNLKMAKYAKKKGIEVDYYISPKVWAWKEWRVKTIKKVVDKMLVIFPFEVDFYKKHGMVAQYVGNPSVSEIDAAMAASPSRAEFLKRNNLQDKPLIALLPGSRLSEIRVNMPIMAAAIKRFPQYRGVIAGAPGVDPEFYKKFGSLPIVFNQTYDLLAHSRGAIVTSGTATLETALAGVPQVAMFRHNGSKLFYKLMKKVLKIKFVTLPNLIADKGIIPEHLLHLCTVDSVSESLGLLLPDQEPRAAMLADYQQMRALLTSAPISAAQAIISDVKADGQQG